MNQGFLHDAAFHRGHGAAGLIDATQFFACQSLQLFDLARNYRRAIENVAIFEKVRFVGQNLLGAKRPLLIPWTRKSQRLVPGRPLPHPGRGVL